MKRSLLILSLFVSALLSSSCADADTEDGSTAPPSVGAPMDIDPSATTPQQPIASDPRCTTASDPVIAQVQSGVAAANTHLVVGVTLIDGPLTFFGATTIDKVGKILNRSDVWVIDGSSVYSVTGGARDTSSWPSASQPPLQISPGDPRVGAVDQCVVNLTRN